MLGVLLLQSQALCKEFQLIDGPVGRISPTARCLPVCFEKSRLTVLRVATIN